VITADGSLSDVCNIQNPDAGLGMKFSLRTVAVLSMLGRDTSSLSSSTDVAAAEPSRGEEARPLDMQAVAVVHSQCGWRLRC